METTWKLSIDNNEDRRMYPADKIASYFSAGVSGLVSDYFRFMQN